MKKYDMYVSVIAQRLYHHPQDSPWEFKIQVPSEYVPIFEQLFDEMNRLEFRNFLRAHLPYMPYHFDRDNHDVDYRAMKVYALVHEFGDEETKRFIEKLPYFV